MSYKDPKRKIGSQSETPEIIEKEGVLIIKGYQEFNICLKTLEIELVSKPTKFLYISQLLKEMNEKYNCNSICDIGCNSGLVSILSHQHNFKKILSLDHDPEYIMTLRAIKNACSLVNINEKVFSFGDKIEDNFDIIFCGALLHWIFSLTAQFRNFDAITQYLSNSTNRFLLIEWIDPEDGAIQTLQHLTINKSKDDEHYSCENFEKSICKIFKINSRSKIDGETRILYFLEKKK